MRDTPTGVRGFSYSPLAVNTCTDKPTHVFKALVTAGIDMASEDGLDFRKRKGLQHRLNTESELPVSPSPLGTQASSKRKWVLLPGTRMPLQVR